MPKVKEKKNRYLMISGRETFCMEIKCSHRYHCGTQCSPNEAMCCFLCIPPQCDEEERNVEGKRNKFIIAYENWLKERNK